MPMLRAAVLAGVCSAGGAVVLRSGSHGRRSGGGRQLGVSMPAGSELDFSAKNPRPLQGVQVAQEAAKAAKEVADRGATSLIMSVDATTGQLSVQAAAQPPAHTGKDGRFPLAWAHYNNTVERNGWAYLTVSATEDPRASRELKMYAAGYLEGYVSAQQIKHFRHNAGVLLEHEEDKHHALGNIRDMFATSLAKLCAGAGMAPGAALLDANTPKDPWSAQARYALMQSWGILDAYNVRAADVADRPMSMVDLIVLNSDGETPELEVAFDSEEYLLRQSQHDGTDNGTADDADAFLQRSASHSLRRAAPSRAAAAAKRRRQELQKLDDAGWRQIKASGGRCSALVRLTKNNGDLMVGHSTFSDYSEMTRVFKYYDLPLGSDSVRRMGFSSYPGVAGSTDDYYLLDSGLVITETTISMLTDEPYDKLDDKNLQVPDFMRIMMANRLAKTAPEWAKLMTKSSSGTYSSQWMVVDYNAFTPGKPVQNGTLVVLEQVPGLSHWEDKSHHLQEMGFWGSENRAWFKDVRASIGAEDAEELHGALFSADNNPRANIFKATAPQVQSLADLRAEMRRNRWPHEVDGGEGNSPDHAIAARGDLDKDRPDANGAVDAKVTNRCLARRLACDAISGPTSATQKPFHWTEEGSGKELFPGAPHEGLPNMWNFDWVRMAPGADGASLAAGEC